MKPVKVTDVDLAFGGKTDKLLPAMEDIPDEFKTDSSKWNQVVSDWFYRGLQGAVWTPKEGVNSADGIRHIQAIMASFQPKHEHKFAGCAYLLNEFFDEVTYKKE